MNAEKAKAGARLNELENRLNIINESITKTEDALISARQVQAITRLELKQAREALAALPD